MIKNTVGHDTDQQNEDCKRWVTLDVANVLGLLATLFDRATDAGDDLILDTSQAIGAGKLLKFLAEELHTCWIENEGLD
jgi:hypothetical protein